MQRTLIVGYAARSPSILQGKFRRSVGMMARRAPKEEGSISSIFTTLDESLSRLTILPERFIELKNQIWKDSFIDTWNQVIRELEVETAEIARKGSEIIPRIAYQAIERGLPAEEVERIKKIGCVLITGGVPKEEALAWKASIREYVSQNRDLVKGFPEDDVQVYEIYNSRSQILARTHPALLRSQKFVLSLWHGAPAQVDLSTPVSYFDRLRIRHPGDQKFTLGPHIDGGSVERWEDPVFCATWSAILSGGANWKTYDPYIVGNRINARGDLYSAPNQCSIFRPWQGWTAMSSTGPGEGTLKVFPSIRLATAYVVLRPFFRRKASAAPDSLKAEDWEPDLTSSVFPGSGMGTTQELSERSHPHMKLDRTMVSIPKVEPGDQVYWHCDLPHAVEARHGGANDSSVMYIPAVPLTLNNASYLRDQREHFVSGLPPPDFPGGQGESKFSGRGSVEDVSTEDGRRMLGFEKFGKGNVDGILFAE